MAISPLALGIGLQGKYDYRQQAALEIARQRGRAKAEAAEEAGKEKKRAEIRKMIVNIKPEGLLPFQQKIMDDGMADLLGYAGDHPDDLPGVTQRSFQLVAKNKAFRDVAEGYKRLSLQQDIMPVDAQALKIVGTLSDPNAIREELSKFGPASSIALTEDQLTLKNPKYERLSTTFAKFVKDSMFDPQQGVNEFSIGNRKYAGAEINTEVPKILTATVMNTDNLKRSAFNDYLSYADQQNIPYDFSTEQGQKEFYDNTTKYVSDNAQTYIDLLSKTYNAEKPRSMNISLRTGDTPESGMLGGPVETETVIETLNPAKPGQQKFAKSLGLLPRFKNFEMTMPVTTTTIDATTGNIFSAGKDKNINATFNGADAYYVAKENIDFPGIRYRKGAIVDENDRGKLIRLGKLDVKFVVFGITDNEDEIYDSYDQAGIIPILGQNKTDAALIKQSLKNATTKFNQYKANLKQFQSPSTSNQSNAPAPKTNTTTTKPKTRTDPTKYGLKKF